MSETVILAIVQGVVDLLAALADTPTQAQVDAAVRQALVRGADLEMQQEFKGEAP